MSKAQPNQTPVDQERFDLFWEPCRSREELKEHIHTFLSTDRPLDLPDFVVDDRSTWSIMDAIWIIYLSMLTGEGNTRHVVAAARNTGKTLMATIVRFYAMIHFRRSGTHLAATEEQSSSANAYLDKFLSIPDVSPYVTITNTRNKTLSGMPRNSFTKKTDAVLRIAIATIKGVNSQRGSFNTRDETDLIPRAILSEAAFINDPTGDEHNFPAITLNLSSRKIADGPMQELIDEADRGGDITKHMWSMVDWMKPCAPETHRPDEPRPMAYLHSETLETIWDDDHFKALPSEAQQRYNPIQAYAGCRTCPAFIACQARSAKMASKSVMLRTIKFTADVLRDAKDADKIRAQALNWEPEKGGKVFKTLSAKRHLMRPIQFFRFVVGRYWIPEGMTEPEALLLLLSERPADILRMSPTKQQIYEAMIADGYHIHFGVDWGYNPAEATCPVVGYNRKRRKVAVLHVDASQEFANNDWADWICANIATQFEPETICPDLEDPASPGYFMPHGFTCWTESKGRIETGVSQIRTYLWNPIQQVSQFAILDDRVDEKNRLDGTESKNYKMFTAMDKWTHRKTAIGFDHTRFEDDHNCDYIDPLRYALAPFLGEMTIGVDVKVGLDPNNKPVLAEEAAKGNLEAKQIMAEQSDPIRQMDAEFARQTGLQGVFSAAAGGPRPPAPPNVTVVTGPGAQKPKTADDSDSKPAQGKSSRKSPIKFSF